MVSGVLANLWSVIDDGPGSAERVVRALLENTDKTADYEPTTHGQGSVNAAKALEALMAT